MANANWHGDCINNLPCDALMKCRARRLFALWRATSGTCVPLQGQGMYGLGNTRPFSCLLFKSAKWAHLAHMWERKPMVASRKTKKIFCTVVRVSVADDSAMRANHHATRNDRINHNGGRPSDLLPWADPYIARLVAKLQAEVRVERTHNRAVSRITGSCLAELEPPSPTIDNDWDWNDERQWSVNDEI